MSDEARSDPMTSGSDEGEEPPSNGSEEDDEATKDVLKKKATRTLKIFRQIAECLEKDMVVEIKEYMSQVMTISSKADDDDKEENLTRVYLRFLDKVEFRAGISVNLIAQAIRCFMMIEEDTEGLGKTVSEMYLEMILTDHPSLAIDMKLTDELLKVYFKLLGEGYEEMQHIRLMVVGMFGVGKTTLVRRLCRKRTDDVTSTEGIDIFQDSCEVKEDLDWEISDPERKERYLNMRLQELITKYRKQDKKIPHDTSSVTPSHVQEPKTTARMPSYEKFEETVTKKNKDTGNKIVDKLKEISTKEEEPRKRRPTVSIWDFAGQSVYYSTHHFFLNARSVYILVLDLSKGLHEEAEEDNLMNELENKKLGNITKRYTCLETFKFWIKSIYIYTKQNKPNDQHKKEYTPKIILVGTFKDRISGEMLKGRTTEQYKDDYFTEALSFIGKTSTTDLVHGKTFLISNTVSVEKDFLSIKEEIYNISTKMPFWNEQVPAKFIPLERAVFKHKQKKKTTMKFSELKEVGLNVEYPYNETEIELFLSFQHAFGNVLYYKMGTHTDQDDRSDPSEMKILTPQWIIDVFKAFVTHKDKTNELNRLDDWRKFEEEGQLSHYLINALLTQHNFLGDKDKVLMYMEHLDVIAKPVIFRTEKDKDSSTPSEAKHYFSDWNMKSETKGENFYVMPCMLPQRPEMEELKDLYKESDKGTDYPPTLCMYLKKGFLPAFILHRLLATALKEMPIAWSKTRKLLFNGLGSFQLTPLTMLTIWSVDNIIHLRVTFRGSCEKVEDKIAFCRALKGRFETLVLQVFNFHGKGTYDESRKAELFEMLVKCPLCEEQVPFDEKIDRNKKPVDYMISLHSVKNLLSVKQKICCCCNNIITAEHALKYWFAIDQQPVNTEEFTQTEKSSLLSVPKDSQLLDLAEEIKWNVEWLLPELQINEIRRKQIEIDHPKTCNLTYYYLYDWITRGESLQMLYDAMKKSAEGGTENFFRIVKEIDSPENIITIDKYMKEIHKGGDATLVLSEHRIVRLSLCFGNEYWFFGIRLGIPESEMQQINLDCKDTKEQVKKILTDWNNRDEPIRRFVRSIVLSRCNWSTIKKTLLNDAEA